jgi:hypothetical protein
MSLDYILLSCFPLRYINLASNFHAHVAHITKNSV